MKNVFDALDKSLRAVSRAQIEDEVEQICAAEKRSTSGRSDYVILMKRYGETALHALIGVVTAWRFVEPEKDTEVNELRKTKNGDN